MELERTKEWIRHGPDKWSNYLSGGFERAKAPVQPVEPRSAGSSNPDFLTGAWHPSIYFHSIDQAPEVTRKQFFTSAQLASQALP